MGTAEFKNPTRCFREILFVARIEVILVHNVV